MAKAAAKTSTKEPKKVSAEQKKVATAPKAKDSSGEKIEKVCEEALGKLKSLDIDHQLQRDIEWCLGSYKSDKNPVGLYSMAERALIILQEEKAKKTKGVTAKLVTDLEKAIENRSDN